METVAGENCADGWAKGALAINLHHGPLSPLITEISNPGFVEAGWWKDLSPNKLIKSANSLNSVVEMLAPHELLTLNRPVVYARAWAKFDRYRAMRRHLSNWHDTYFERLTRGEGYNRLDEIILKMRAWPARRVAPFYAHTSNGADRVIPIGSPCLQYVQFAQRDSNRLDIFALYRNHDFFLKALGNFIGLGRLLNFVARETNQIPGKLICFSVNAYLDHQRKVCPLARSILKP